VASGGDTRQAGLPETWPTGLPVRHVRIARPTDRLEEVVAFYRDGLGLAELDRFEDHEGYSGVMLGLPGAAYHLEFTTHVAGSPGAAPSAENLLVLYFGSPAERDRVVGRLRDLGHRTVEAENPFWENAGAVTVEDPDGWRVVLAPHPVY
jgi:catechol 2,3-dioxygenase-like lactoylglutathione lyase family enzyme